MVDYAEFLDSKLIKSTSHGVAVQDSDIHSILFQFQRDITRWGCRKGKAAMFLDTGLGKTFCQLEWARLIGGTCLIFSPLTVAKQTRKMARKIGLEVKLVRDGSEMVRGINITNYDLLPHFETCKPDAVVLDESSCLKSLTSVHRQQLISSFHDVPNKLCCTATPSPNDIAEICNHAEFLNVMTRVETLATFFVHDDEGWRLKGHAVQPFYRWLSSWAIACRKPSDLGYQDDGFLLPPLNVHTHWVDADPRPKDGALFFTGLSGISDRCEVRRQTCDDRCAMAEEIINSDNDQWIVWCGLNPEAEMMVSLIPGAVNVYGSMSPEDKTESIQAFQEGKTRVLVTKLKIAGLGLNLQCAHKMCFVGMNDSMEMYYQGVRRSLRYGQEHPVDVHIVLARCEEPILRNVQGKEQEANYMMQELIAHSQEYQKAELKQEESRMVYREDEAHGESWKLYLGDSAERLKEVETGSIGLSVMSPPFASLYVYSASERDLGNSRDEKEFFRHFRYIIRELLRITMPGRICCIHVAQVPAMLVRDGYIGMKDFRGKTIETFESEGWIYYGESVIEKNPQAQAIRTKAKGLAFKQLHKDASWLRPCLLDFILIFRKDGENLVPVVPDIDNNTWIDWASGVWRGIDEGDTLNVAEARSEKDERHLCALQLETIERCIRLWSNRGETICSAFAGIGSEGYKAVELGRKFVGSELNENYWRVGCKNLKDAERKATAGTLFASVASE